MDISGLKKRAATAQPKGSNNNIFLKTEDGQRIRLMDDFEGDDCPSGFIELRQYWDILDGNKPFVLVANDDDPIHAHYVLTSDDTYKPQTTFVAPVILRGSESEGLKLLRVSPFSMTDSLLPTLEDDPNLFFGLDAHDLKISKTDNKKGFVITKYSAVIKSETLENVEFDEDIKIEKILGISTLQQANDLMDTRRAKSKSSDNIAKQFDKLYKNE